MLKKIIIIGDVLCDVSFRDIFESGLFNKFPTARIWTQGSRKQTYKGKKKKEKENIDLSLSFRHASFFTPHNLQMNVWGLEVSFLGILFVCKLVACTLGL